MGLFGKRKDQATDEPQPQQPKTPQKPAQAAAQKPAPTPASKPAPKVEERDPTLPPLEPEIPGSPTQRGSISDQRAALLRMQIQIADNIRKKFLAPNLSLDLPLERTPEREQM